MFPLSPVALRLDAMYHDTAHATTAITPSVRRIALVIASLHKLAVNELVPRICFDNLTINNSCFCSYDWICISIPITTLYCHNGTADRPFDPTCDTSSNGN